MMGLKKTLYLFLGFFLGGVSFLGQWFDQLWFKEPPEDRVVWENDRSWFHNVINYASETVRANVEFSMKFLTFTILCLFLFAAAASARPICPLNAPTKEEFLADVSQRYEVFTLTKEGQEKLRKFIQKVSKEKINDSLELYFALVEVNTTGIAYVMDGCLKPETVLRVPSAGMAKVFQDAGILPEEILEVVINKESQTY